MNILLDFITEELVQVNMDAKDKFDCIEQLADLLYEKGYVKDTYKHAVREREKIYPTGLELNNFGVAIPHTDAVHVHKPAVAIGIVNEPVAFNLMGEVEEKEVPVRILFQLAISEPKQQIEMLQSVVGLFTEDRLLNDLQEAASPTEVISLLKGALV